MIVSRSECRGCQSRRGRGKAGTATSSRGVPAPPPGLPGGTGAAGNPSAPPLSLPTPRPPVRKAITGGVGGENARRALGSAPRREQGGSAAVVVAKMGWGVCHEPADKGKSREMQDRRDLVGAQRGGEPRRIVQIAFDKRSPAHRLAVPARQIVIDDRAVTGAGQCLASVTADIPGATRDQNRLRPIVLTGRCFEPERERWIAHSSSIREGCVS